LEPLKLASVFGGQLVIAELDLRLRERAGEFKRHLRIVLVDDGRTGVLAAVETFVEGEFAQRIGSLDATLPDWLAIDGKRIAKPSGLPLFAGFFFTRGCQWGRRHECSQPCETGLAKLRSSVALQSLAGAPVSSRIAPPSLIRSSFPAPSSHAGFAG
jgi:hypothetical protein